MGAYAIRAMYDESGNPFVPLTSIDAVIGEKNVQYIMDSEELSAGHFRINLKDLTLDNIVNCLIVVRWPQISSTIKPSYLQLNEEEEKPLFNGNGTEYLNLEEASNTVNMLAYDGSKWILSSGAGSGAGHVITNADGETMEQQKILNFVGFKIENDAANRATKITNPEPINNLETTISGQGSLDAYQGHILSMRSVPTGGDVGQVLAKKSENDYDLEWVNRAGDDVIQGDGSIEQLVSLSYDEYQELEANGEIDPLTQYYIYDLGAATEDLIGTRVQEITNAALDSKMNISYSYNNKDLNDLIETAFYYCNSATNRPTNTNGYIFVQNTGTEYAYQRYITYNGARTYERVRVDGEWQPWTEVIYDSGWRDLELLNGWSIYSGQVIPQIRRIGKHVYLRGLLLATADTSARYAIVIPEDCRPNIINNLYFNMVVANNNDSTKRCEMVQITPPDDGRILVFGSYKDGDWFGLENLHWSID
jgi:hypothetical protein